MDAIEFSALEAERPRVARLLCEADRRRRSNAASLAYGARLRGYEQLLTTLDRIVTGFEADSELQLLARLMKRARADFETALDATLAEPPWD